MIVVNRPGFRLTPSSIRVEPKDVQNLPVIALKRNMRAEVQDSRQALIRVVAGLLTRTNGAEQFQAKIAAGLGWQVETVGDIKHSRKYDCYLVGKVPVTGGKGERSVLAVVMPVQGHDLLALTSMIRESKAADALRELGILPQSYGLFVVTFEWQPGFTMPIYVREYISGHSLQHLFRTGALNNDHISALGQLFGQLLPVSGQVCPINIHPDHIVLTETPTGPRARICNFSEMTEGVGLVGYLRQGLSGEMFELGLNNRNKIKVFTRGLYQALPPGFLTGILPELKGELVWVNASLAALRKMPVHERTTDTEQMKTKQLLYKTFILELSTLSA